MVTLLLRKLLQELPDKRIKAISQIVNAIIETNSFPNIWKVGQIEMIPKLAKNWKMALPTDPLASAVENHYKALLSNIKYRFWSLNRENSSRNTSLTLEIIGLHRVSWSNREQNQQGFGRFYSSAFLDINQKHTTSLPTSYYWILKSFLTNRNFLVKQDNEYTDLQPINSRVPQEASASLYLIPKLILDFNAASHSKRYHSC